MDSQRQYKQQQDHSYYGINERPIQQELGDLIEQLPSDTSVPSHNEIRIVDQLFQHKGMFDHILHNTKDIFILGALFAIFSLPFIDNLIKKFIKISSTSQYILISIKTILFIILYFILTNLQLIRTNN
jgi:hypothetical protein